MSEDKYYVVIRVGMKGSQGIEPMLLTNWCSSSKEEAIEKAKDLGWLDFQIVKLPYAINLNESTVEWCHIFSDEE